MSNITKQQQSQNVPTEGILTSALNTAKQVAQTIGEKTQQVTHTLGEKIGFDFSDHSEFTKFTDPLATPKDLALAKSHLKHVQTRDGSKPVIEKGVHILQNHHKVIFAEILKRRELNHVKIARDASAPFLDKSLRIKESPQKKIFVDIREHHYQLRHVNTNDRSRPVIPRDLRKRSAPVLPSTEGFLEAGKEKLSSAFNTAKQMTHNIGEKTQQVAHTLGAKMGYRFSSDLELRDVFVPFSDQLANPKDLALAKSQLKHVSTRDSSKPIIDRDIHIKQNTHNALFSELRQRRELKHVETRDRSAPFLDKSLRIKESPQKKIFVDIREHNYKLRHVGTNDRSMPVIPRDARVEKSVLPSTEGILEAGKEKLSSAIRKTTEAAQTLGEKTTQAAQTLGQKTTQAAQTLGEKTSQAAHSLGEKTQQAAQTLGEKTQQATHALEAKIGYKLIPDENERSEFVKFVDPLASPRDLESAKSHLKHTQTRDKSKPIIENDVHIKENHHKELLVEIEKRHDLNHVKTTHDASKPFIDKSIHIQEAPQKRVLEDITQHHQLKHVKMNDKSAPMIPRDVHIKLE
jgi:hypothetical protein